MWLVFSNDILEMLCVCQILVLETENKKLRDNKAVHQQIEKNIAQERQIHQQGALLMAQERDIHLQMDNNMKQKMQQLFEENRELLQAKHVQGQEIDSFKRMLSRKAKVLTHVE